MQKQYHRAEAQAELNKRQEEEIDSLKAQLRLQNVRRLLTGNSQGACGQRLYAYVHVKLSTWK